MSREQGEIGSWREQLDEAREAGLRCLRAAVSLRCVVRCYAGSAVQVRGGGALVSGLLQTVRAEITERVLDLHKALLTGEEVIWRVRSKLIEAANGRRARAGWIIEPSAHEVVLTLAKAMLHAAWSHAEPVRYEAATTAGVWADLKRFQPPPVVEHWDEVVRSHQDVFPFDEEELRLRIAEEWAKASQHEEGHARSPSKEQSGGEEKNDPPYQFVRDGTIWHIRYKGERGSCRHLKGLEYIHRLLHNPNRHIPARELRGHSNSPVPETHTYQEVLDPEAKRSYQERLEEIEGELKEAEKNGDQSRIAKLKGERQFLADEVVKATGWREKGRQRSNNRSFGPRPDESARLAVRVALGRAFKSLRANDPPLTNLVDHLEASIHCEGTSYVYHPVPEVPWKLAIE